MLRSGFQCKTAGVHTPADQEEKEVTFATREGYLGNMNFQVAVVSNGRGIVHELVEDGMEATFKKEGTYILQPSRAAMENAYECKSSTIVPSEGDNKVIKVLNRIIMLQGYGLTYKADPRHADIIVNELRLSEAKPLKIQVCNESIETKDCKAELSDWYSIR